MAPLFIIHDAVSGLRAAGRTREEAREKLLYMHQLLSEFISVLPADGLWHVFIA